MAFPVAMGRGFAKRLQIKGQADAPTGLPSTTFRTTSIAILG